MKKITLFIIVLSISFSIFSQDVVLLKNGNVMTGKLISNKDNILNNENNYEKYILVSPGVSTIIDYAEIKSFVQNYESVSRAQYFRRATSQYNGSTIFSIVGAGSSIMGVGLENEALLLLGVGSGVVSLIFQIAANQQFKKVANLIEVELAANKVGLNIRF
ncbi:MAG: hypothetical protein HN704_05715 [Bacteroidetes bacterium]|jgi:hypothetical protein|nr:hypothetical protein [Bacteroidota bacterium]MBT7491089.1 hypothetical protein [Bacteroidota bacterium]